MAIALARPQWGEQTELIYSVGEDILFLVDCSQSMLATDVRPNRLGRAKLAVIDFMQQHSRGRAGLVAFAGQAFLQCPLTFDHEAFREAVMALDGQVIPMPGTDLGRALEEGFLAMEKNDRRKIMILITDGEDLEKTGVRTAQDLAAKDVRVFTVGVGTPAGIPIQVAAEQGSLVSPRDSQGKVVLSRLDETTLRTIANATHGSYQPLGTAGDGLRRIGQTINQYSDLPNQRSHRKLGVDRFHLPVGIVTVLLVIESFVRTRKRHRPKGTGPLPRLGLALVAGGCLTFSSVAQLPPEITGRESPDQWLARGTQELLSGKLREAEQSLTAALACQVDHVQPAALFNLGHVRFRQGSAALKQGPEAPRLETRLQSQLNQVPGVLQGADAALTSQNLEAIVTAYRRGTLTRRQLRQTTEAVKSALEIYRTALLRWERSSGDFQSACELNASDDQARENGEIVDAHIARLIDQIRRLEQGLMMMEQLRQQLQERMKGMKKFLPDEGEKDGGEEEDEESQEPKPKPGDMEKLVREGQERLMTREEAARLLESLKLDANRKLPMGTDRTGAPPRRTGRTW
jgi:Ca-activated chloride channel family protein